MANDKEALADISAELRDKCATHYCCEEARRKDGEYPEGFDVIDTSKLANRIDAAAKRAEAKWEGAACACVSDAVMSGKIAVEHKPAGNSDALRLALSGIRLWFVAAANVLDEDASARVTPKALRKLAKDCDAALAAPAVDCPPSNVAALRDALLPFPSLCEWLVENAAKLGISDMVPKLRERCDKARAALGTTPADPPILCDAITFIAREMRERTDLDGRGMVDNFHIEYGEYGGFDALELIHAYGELLDECWKRIRDIFTNLAYSAHGVVVFHGPATERLRTLGFYVDRALLSLTASDPTLPPRKSRPDFIIIDDPHNDEVPTDKSIAPTESEASNG